MRHLGADTWGSSTLFCKRKLLGVQLHEEKEEEAHSRVLRSQLLWRGWRNGTSGEISDNVIREGMTEVMMPILQQD